MPSGTKDYGSSWTKDVRDEEVIEMPHIKPRHISKALSKNKVGKREIRV